MYMHVFHTLNGLNNYIFVLFTSEWHIAAENRTTIVCRKRKCSECALSKDRAENGFEV
jgi:hypothetical protein